MINKTITLTGEGASNSKIMNIDTTPAWDRDLYPIYPPSAPVAIRIDGSNVKVSGFTIAGIEKGYSPLWLFAGGVRIENNVIEDGGLIMVRSNNNTIARNSIGNGVIELSGSYNNFLHNKVTGRSSISEGAIYLKGSYNLLFGNAFKDVSGSHLAINIFVGDYNIIAKNNLTRSGGIEIGVGSSNIIFGNRLFNSGGLYISAASDNVLFANHVENGLGAYLADNPPLLKNTFFRNNFINNTLQIRLDYHYDSENYGDGREGNYYSDYNGIDADNDGIGDTPYVIEYEYEDYTWKDNFPLMAPFDLSTINIELTEWTKIEVDLQPSSQLPTTLVLAVAVAAVAVVVIVVGLLVYFKKRNHKAENGNFNF